MPKAYHDDEERETDLSPWLLRC